MPFARRSGDGHSETSRPESETREILRIVRGLQAEFESLRQNVSVVAKQNRILKVEDLRQKDDAGPKDQHTERSRSESLREGDLVKQPSQDLVKQPVPEPTTLDKQSSLASARPRRWVRARAAVLNRGQRRKIGAVAAAPAGEPVSSTRTFALAPTGPSRPPMGVQQSARASAGGELTTRRRMGPCDGASMSAGTRAHQDALETTTTTVESLADAAEDWSAAGWVPCPPPYIYGLPSRALRGELCTGAMRASLICRASPSWVVGAVSRCIIRQFSTGKQISDIVIVVLAAVSAVLAPLQVERAPCHSTHRHPRPRPSLHPHAPVSRARVPPCCWPRC